MTVRDPSVNGKSMLLMRESNGEEELLHALRNKLVGLVFIYKFWSISKQDVCLIKGKERKVFNVISIVCQPFKVHDK